MTSVAQVEQLLATYLDTVREQPTGTADPFEPSAFQVLLNRCEGRIGQLLPEAYAVLEEAAEAQVPSISAQFIMNMPGQKDEVTVPPTVSDEDTLDELWNG